VLTAGRIDAGFLRAAAAPPGIRLQPRHRARGQRRLRLGFAAAGLGVTVVAASYQALSLEGVRFVPVVGTSSRSRSPGPHTTPTPPYQHFWKPPGR
jgi:hypothetical protein